MGWVLLYFWQTLFISFDTNSPFPFPVQLVNCINPDIAMNYAITLAATYESQGRQRFNKIMIRFQPMECIGATFGNLHHLTRR